MELFKLFGTIAVNNKDANKALDETSGKGQQAHSRLTGAFSSIGKGAVALGKTIATGLAVGAAAMGALTVKALDLSGQLEQNMGGSEAVFGEYAGKMQETARNAFAQMGLSTSDYLATANKMGALFQGAGFSIEESMTLSSDCMQRAADVASIMGIDTSAAMEAIAGAAKGNFTMMDNLGVAMNDAAIEAYALSKGIDKSVSEMTMQEKIAIAMEMFMEKTAYATGNYAKENDTLAGSLGTAKAALTNFLDGSGDVDQLVNAFSHAANVIVKNINELAPRLISGITEIVNKIIPMLPPLLNSLLPTIINGAISLVQGLVDAMPTVIQTLLDATPAVLSGIEQIFNALVTALPQLINMLVGALPTLIPMLIDAVVNMVVTLCNSIDEIIQPIIAILPDLIIKVVEALVRNLPILIDGIITLVMGIVRAIPQIIEGLVDATPTVISMLVQAILECTPQIIAGLVQVVWEIIKAIPRILGDLLRSIVGFFQGIWDAVKNVFAPVGEWFSNMWNSLGNVPGLSSMKTAIENIWKAIKDYISTVINAIKNVVTTVWNSIKNVVMTVVNSIKNVISTVWNSIKTIVTNIMSGIKSVLKGDWEGVKNSISNILQAIKNVISSVWNGIKNTLTSILQGIVNVFASVWNSIVSVVTKYINMVKTTISNVWNGIKNTTSAVMNGIKNTISGAFENIKSKATSIWNGIKNAITNPIESAKNTIKNIVDKIKGFFSGMKIEWPKIKMPHFGITPKGWKIGDLLHGSIPKLGIDWYAKGGIMDEPTIFGVNGNRLMGGGEAGKEAIAPIDTLQNYVRDAVRSEMGLMESYMLRLMQTVDEYLPKVAEGRNVVLDTGALVGAMGSQIDSTMGNINRRKGRWG